METNELNYQQPYSRQLQLPNATAVLVLGIMSIILCCCWGIMGLICGIIAIVLAKKDMAVYYANPDLYTDASFKNLKAGRICAIRGVSFSALYMAIVIILLITIGTAIFFNPQEVLRHYQNY